MSLMPQVFSLMLTLLSRFTPGFYSILGSEQELFVRLSFNWLNQRQTGGHAESHDSDL